MRKRRHLLAGILLALCLLCTACGKTDDIAGDDWRATGVVVGSGTITRGGDSVDVLVTVSESSAAFYRDLPEQVLFDSVSFPMTIPDGEQAFNAISFDDMDGDGESDVLVSFIYENGDATELILDPGTRWSAMCSGRTCPPSRSAAMICSLTMWVCGSIRAKISGSGSAATPPGSF